MGHFHNTVIGYGKSRDEAQGDAIQAFLDEEGNRHSVREVSKPELVEEIPPLKMTKRKEGNNIIMQNVKDESAPKSEWVQKWRFELHTHA